VIPESEYAGRLTGFKTPNPWAYAMVDFFPYSISFFGIPLIVYCRRRKYTVLLGLGIILAFALQVWISNLFFRPQHETNAKTRH
jgi:hypothetical protein